MRDIVPSFYVRWSLQFANHMCVCLLFSFQEMFEKRRRRRESHNAVERRRRDNINERIYGEDVTGFHA